jgi:O-antigen/teichoic acid export membrane protein
MISHILSKVSFPLYSKILSEYENRDDKFKKIYLKITNVVSIISFPLIGLAFILTPDIINMLFDNKWVHVAVIMQIFLLKAPIDIISAGFASPVLYSYGKPSWLFTLELFVIPVRLILILIAARISIEAVAITWLIIIFLKSLTLQILVSKISNIPMREYIASLKFAFIGVFIVTIIFHIIKIMLDYSGIPLIVCTSVLYCAAYATLLYSLDKKNCRDLIADFKNYASHLL